MIEIPTWLEEIAFSDADAYNWIGRIQVCVVEEIEAFRPKLKNGALPLVHPPQNSWAASLQRKRFYPCIREIVTEDSSKVGTKGSHISGAALAQSNSVTLANAFENYFVTLFACRERIAGHGIPAKFSADCNSSGFALRREHRRVLSGKRACPTNWVFIAMIATDGVIGIAARRRITVSGYARRACATAREHCDDRLVVEREHQASRGHGGLPCQTLRGRGFAKKLTMGQVTEIKVRMAATTRHQIRPTDDCLRF